MVRYHGVRRAEKTNLSAAKFWEWAKNNEKLGFISKIEGGWVVSNILSHLYFHKNKYASPKWFYLEYFLTLSWRLPAKIMFQMEPV